MTAMTKLCLINKNEHKYSFCRDKCKYKYMYDNANET